MAASEDCYDQAAVRHFADAEQLAAVNHFDGAGHLIGFAAECAIKHALGSLRPSANGPQGHLPTLVEAAKKAVQGTSRRSLGLLALLRQPDYFAGWSVNARYGRDGTVDTEQYVQWKRHAQRTLAAAGLRGALRE